MGNLVGLGSGAHGAGKKLNTCILVITATTTKRYLSEVKDIRQCSDLPLTFTSLIPRRMSCWGFAQTPVFKLIQKKPLGDIRGREARAGSQENFLFA